MRIFESALVVDGSSVARPLFARYLRMSCKSALSAASIDEARAAAAAAAPEIVLLDATLAGALAWFEECSAASSKAAFVVVTSRPAADEEVRVTLAGAIGYLAKPVSARQLARALAMSEGSPESRFPRAQVAPLAPASIDDPASGEPQVSCDVVNMGATGALLATSTPLSRGTALLLRLSLDGDTLLVPARVVRVQEPGWNVSGGCGVVFEYQDEGQRSLVERFVDERIERERASARFAAERSG